MSDINVQLQDDLNITQNSDEISVTMDAEINAESVADTIDVTTADAQPINITLQEVLLRESAVGVTDHGALTGLADDDHTQYHNDTRGDARYYTQAQIATILADYLTSATASNTYYTEAEVDAIVADFITEVIADGLYLRRDQNLADLTDWAAAISELKLDSPLNGQGASLIAIEDTASKYTATTVEAALAEIPSEGEGDARYIRRANDSGSLTPGYEKNSSVDGITADYISNKTLHNIAIKGHPATKQVGSFWIDTTVTPNVLHIYHDDAEKTIMTDFTMENDELEHLPNEFTIDVWSGNSNQLGANGLPLIQEYQTSAGAYPVPLLIDGGSF